MGVTVDLTRFEEKIREYESYPVEKGKILLYGSSFFTNWGYDRAIRQLAGLGGEERPVVNHGFGGATADELLYYYPRMVRPYAPRILVWRGGPNDIFSGLGPEEAWQITQRVFSWAKKDFPAIKIVILAIFDYRSQREEVRPAFAEYNRLCRQFAQSDSQTVYWDINDFFYKDPADIGSFQNFRDVFVSDGLHLTDAAYEEFALYFKRKAAAWL